MSVPGDDRAFLYGDGLFETLLCIRGQLLWPELHVDRLLEGGARLGIAIERSAAEFRLAQAAQGLRDKGATVLRLTVSRGGGTRGYAPAPDSLPNWYFSATVLEEDPLSHAPALCVSVASISMAEQPALAGIKHCNRLEQVLAAREAVERGVDDVILLTEAGFAQCSSNANLFALQGDRLITPPCNRCGIRGTRRRLLLEKLGPDLGLQVEEKRLRVADLLASDALFLSNSVRGVRSLSRLDAHEFVGSPWFPKLQHAYVQAALACIGS
ncbi:MAG: 4-amino-4-deoxychorismate lyase [Halieaceae bacterium]|jgi:4-amino-4-deoxychorismate lyase